MTARLIPAKRVTVDEPQPGQWVRVTWHRSGAQRVSAVDAVGYYVGKGAAALYPDTVAVELLAVPIADSSMRWRPGDPIYRPRDFTTPVYRRAVTA